MNTVKVIFRSEDLLSLLHGSSSDCYLNINLSRHMDSDEFEFCFQVSEFWDPESDFSTRIGYFKNLGLTASSAKRG